MESEFIAQLLDLGITGIFIGYLLWANKTQTKRLDEYVDRLLATLSELESKREEGYEQIRNRYDVVIDRYNIERDQLMKEIARRTEDEA